MPPPVWGMWHGLDLSRLAQHVSFISSTRNPKATCRRAKWCNVAMCRGVNVKVGARIARNAYDYGWLRQGSASTNRSRPYGIKPGRRHIRSYYTICFFCTRFAIICLSQRDVIHCTQTNKICNNNHRLLKRLLYNLYNLY